MNSAKVKELQEIREKVIDPCLEWAQNSIPFFELKDSAEKTVLYGAPGAILDSLNLVTFVFQLEEQVDLAFQVKIKITTQDVLNTELSPFASLDNLAHFLKAKISSLEELDLEELISSWENCSDLFLLEKDQSYSYARFYQELVRESALLRASLQTPSALAVEAENSFASFLKFMTALACGPGHFTFTLLPI